MKPTEASRRASFFLAAALLLPGAVSSLPVVPEAELASADAGGKLVALAVSEKRVSDSIELLEQYGPRLVSGTERRRALIVLAGLRELTGSFGQAADAWRSASAAVGGDPACLLEAARCLIAVGETERALAEVAAASSSGAGPELAARARVLAAFAAAFRREERGASLLRAIAADDAFLPERASALYALHRLYGDEDARKRLSKEFPTSPEALLEAGSGAALASLPVWLLAADRAAVKAGAASDRPGAQRAPGPAAEPAPEPAEKALLQVGLFREERNARALEARLAAKGFSARTASRAVSGNSYWAVTVDPGASIEETAMRLKDAGFESYPLF